MKVFACKTKDGRDSWFAVVDHGRDRPCYDEKGNMFEGYQITVAFNGEMFVNQTDRCLAERSFDPSTFRQSEDLALLDELGIAVPSIQWETYEDSEFFDIVRIRRDPRRRAGPKTLYQK